MSIRIPLIALSVWQLVIYTLLLQIPVFLLLVVALLILTAMDQHVTTVMHHATNAQVLDLLDALLVFLAISDTWGQMNVDLVTQTAESEVHVMENSKISASHVV